MTQGAVCAYGEGDCWVCMCIAVVCMRIAVVCISATLPRRKKIQCCEIMRKNWERNQSTERSIGRERKTEIESVRRV